MNLPEQTLPPDEPTRRRHAPRPVSNAPRGYEAFRSCLRWEFGFTCALCLLHETQLAPFGARGSGQFTIEHRALQKDRTDLIGAYENLLYACAGCNRHRRIQPLLDHDGSRLLDPCQEPWADHFRLDGDILHPTTPHGVYTRDVYDLNSETKVALRRERREILQAARAVLREAPGLLEDLAKDLLDLPEQRRLSRIGQMHMLDLQMQRARQTLDRYRAVPRDHDDSCRCDTTEHHSLPAWMKRQVQEAKTRT